MTTPPASRLRRALTALERVGPLEAAAVALVVRVAYLATADGPSFRDPLLDADYYDALGVAIANGEGLPPGPFWQPPLYPLLVGALYAVLGPSLLWPRLVQALLGAVTAGLAASVATRASGSRLAGGLGGLACAVHGPLVFYAGELLSTTVGTFAATLAIWLATGGPGWTRAIGSGAAIGVGTIALPAIGPALLPVAVAVSRGRPARSVACAAAALAFLAAAAVANHARSGEWVLVSTNGGINLYIGNNPDSDRTIAIRPGREWEELVALPRANGALGPVEEDAWFRDRALEWCAEAPLACATNLAWKARLLLVARDLPRNESLDVVRTQSPVLRAITPRRGSVAFPYVLLLPLAAAGAVFAFASRRRDALVLVAGAIALAAAPVLTFVTGRYRAPMAPILCALAGVGVVAILELRGRARIAAVACAGVVLALAILPVRVAVDDVDFEAELHYLVAGRRARLGDAEGAMSSWKEALRVRPDYLEAGANLAAALEGQDRWDEAVAVLKHTAAHHPHDLGLRYELGRALIGAGRDDEAQAHYRAMLVDAPDAAHLGLGWRALAGGDLREAEREAALAGPPEDPRVEELLQAIEEVRAAGGGR